MGDCCSNNDRPSIMSITSRSSALMGAIESPPFEGAPDSTAALAKRRVELLYGILRVDLPFERGARESSLEWGDGGDDCGGEGSNAKPGETALVFLYALIALSS